MKNSYKRRAWLVDDNLLIPGYISKRKFYPYDLDYGFSYQKIRKKDIDKIVFFNKQKALQITGLQIYI